MKPVGQVITTPTLSGLEETIRKCRRCRLWKGATNAVPGEGPADGKVMLVGQNPGIEEDKTGKAIRGEVGEIPRRCPGAKWDSPRFSVYNKHREAQDSGQPRPS